LKTEPCGSVYSARIGGMQGEAKRAALPAGPRAVELTRSLF